MGGNERIRKLNTKSHETFFEKDYEQACYRQFNFGDCRLRHIGIINRLLKSFQVRITLHPSKNLTPPFWLRI